MDIHDFRDALSFLNVFLSFG